MSPTHPQSQKLPEDRELQRELRPIITDPNGAQRLVELADQLGKQLQNLSTSQIRALFGEVRQIQAQWSINRQRAFRRLVLLKPKMKYRARKERGDKKKGVEDLVKAPKDARAKKTAESNKKKGVEDLVNVLEQALDLVITAPPRDPNASPGAPNNQDDNFQRFVEFFEAILAYHKAHGGQ